MEGSNPVNVSETLEALIQVVDNSSIVITSCASSPQTPTSEESLMKDCKTQTHGNISNMSTRVENKDETQLGVSNDWLHRPVVPIHNAMTDLEESKTTNEGDKSNSFNNPDDVSSIVDGMHATPNPNMSILHQNLFHDTHHTALQNNSCAFQTPGGSGLGSPKIDNFNIPNVIGNFQHRNGMLVHNSNSPNAMISNNSNIMNNICGMSNGYCNTRGPLTFNSASNDCNTLSMMGSGGMLIGNSIGGTLGSTTLVYHNSGRCGGVTTPKKRSRSAPWTVTEMLTLIDAKREERERCYLYKASGVKLPAAEKWRIVAMHMESKDMGRSGSQCQDKWENMMKDYKAVREWQFVKPLAQSSPPGVIKNYFKDMTNKERKDACLPPQMDEIVFFSLHAIQNEKEEKKERARRKVSDQYRARVTEQCINNTLKEHQQVLCTNAKLRAAGETFIKDRVVTSPCYMKDYRDDIKEQTHSVDHSSTIRECLGATHESIPKDRMHDGESFIQKDHEGVESTFNDKDSIGRCHLGNDLSSSLIHPLGGYQNSLHKDHLHEDQMCIKTNTLYNKAYHKVEAMKDLISQGTSEDGLINAHINSTLPNLFPQKKTKNSMSIEKIDIDHGDTNRDNLAEFTMDTDSDYGGKIRKRKKTVSLSGAEAEIADQQDGSGVGPVGQRANLENPVLLDDFMNVINKEGSTLSFKEIIDCFMKVLERNGRQHEAEFCNKIRDTSSLVQVLVVLADAVKAIAQRL